MTQYAIQVRIEYDNLAPALQRTQKFLDAGASHFVYTLSSPYPDDIVYRIADEVVEKVG